MGVFAVVWAIFLFIYYKVYKTKNTLLYLSAVPVVFSTLSGIFDTKIGDIIFPIFYWILSVYLTKETGTKVSVFPYIVYPVVITAGFILYFLGLEYSYILPLSAFFLVVRKYKTEKEAVLWITAIFIICASYFIDKNLFFVANTLLVFPLIGDVLDVFQKNAERERNLYQSIFDGAVNTELQRYHDELNEQLSITLRRQREIFKLSNKTIKPVNLEDILKNVVNGLLDLGYTGILVKIEYKNIKLQHKGGFFPKMELFLKEDYSYIDGIEISEDERFIFLPLLSDEGKIGILGVYKKDGISPSEVEYLRTYANSVAISIAKTVYFKELGYLESVLSKMFESIDIGIAILDDKFNIETWNTALEKIFGKKPEGNFFEAFPEMESLKNKFKDVVKERKTIDITVSPLEKKGKTFRVKLIPLSLNESTVKVVLFIEDITEKVKLEAQLIETEKHAVVGKLAAGLSHDIKNPLASIAASAFSIKRRAKDDEKIKKLAENIEKNSSRAVDIIDKLLNYAKPSYYKKQKTDLKSVLELSVEFSLPPSKREKVILEKNIQEEIFVYADKNSLQQVFINLIMNAIEAMNGGGKISITATKNGEFAEIRIKDTGSGIPEEVLENIFEPFFTTKEKGTGLGLSVVSKIIKDHNGYIDVKSIEGEGTEFIINLPLYKDGGSDNE